jgi:hypothetical protein
VAAERAGEPDAVDLLYPEALHQQRDTGIQGGLGELDRAHVGLRDLQLHRAPVQDIGEGPAALDHAIRARREAPVDHAVLVDDARKIHLRDDFDDSRAAHAGDAGRGRRRFESGLVGPQVAADYP